MIDLGQFPLFLAAALLLAATPGPGVFYVAARTLSGGRGEDIASSFGNGFGGLVHVVAGAMGVSAVVLASAEAFTALKLIGAAYLMWIGVRTIHRPATHPQRCHAHRGSGPDWSKVIAGSQLVGPLGPRSTTWLALPNLDPTRHLPPP